MKNKLTTLEDLENKILGQKGTPKRDTYEYSLQLEILGLKFREIREKQGYSIEELSKVSEVSKAKIIKIESGKWSISVNDLAKLSHILNTNIELAIAS